MMPSFARLGAALVLAATATLATACAATPPPAPESTATSAPTPSTPAPEATVEPTEAPPAADPTCDTLISDATVDDFVSIGWTSRAEPLYIGGVEVPGGLHCVWADFEGPAGDHLQLFGWAVMDANAAAAAQRELETQGWLRENGPDGVYITEPPETTIATDDEGYGMTYLFGDGWVKLADTKQGLILIEWPRG